MGDEGLLRQLDAAEFSTEPDADFLDHLYALAAEEIGFRQSSTLDVEGGPVAPPRDMRGARRGSGWALLIAAGLVLSVAVGLTVGGAVNRPEAPAPDAPPTLLGIIREAGRIRIAIRPDHPQFTLEDQSAAGFDADIAREIAERLGVEPELIVIEATAMRMEAASSWDIALPSESAATIDHGQFVLSQPYYYWPHRLIVSAGSNAQGLRDVAGGPICAVAGDAGEAWLRDEGISEVLVRAADADCLSSLAAGEVAAAVTAELSDADLRVRHVRVIGGPEAEPRAVIVRSHGLPDPADLVVTIDEALAAMRADGTLSGLSQKRFGGDDLTNP